MFQPTSWTKGMHKVSGWMFFFFLTSKYFIWIFKMVWNYRAIRKLHFPPPLRLGGMLPQLFFFFFGLCDLHSHTLLLLLREHKLAEGAIQRGERELDSFPDRSNSSGHCLKQTDTRLHRERLHKHTQTHTKYTHSPEPHFTKEKKM